MVILPGYNFRYQPGIVEHEHSESAGGDHEHHEMLGHEEHGEGHEHHEDSHATNAGHSHNTYGNELFFMLGTKAIPYVTPSMLFVCDLNNTPGSYLEIRLDGAIPLYREIFNLQPYALLGLNLGYNTRAYYGWNNFQFGLKAIWKINRAISIFGGINYSVVMTALKDIDQGNEVWAQLFLSDEDAERIRNFLVNDIGIKPKFVLKRLHTTLYHARRPMPGLKTGVDPVKVVVPASDTRFMVLAPGGENPRPNLDPAIRKVGVRVQWQSQAMPDIQRLRERLEIHAPATLRSCSRNSNRAKLIQCEDRGC